ncbi:MAG: leucine-rich repeat domain-containing protein [Bacteroides sp.]|nr:leucine-rich repeat domain-containing protein [Bacteroides sp.]
MAIYQNGNKLTTLYNSGLSVNKGYINGDVVFDKGGEVDNSYIEFEIDATSGTYIIPCSGYAANGSAYSFKVYMDGVYSGDIAGVVNSNTGTGNTIIFGVTDTKIIRLEPTNGVTPGWGIPFGYYSGTSGCNASSNKAKIRRILNDPDYAHLSSETSTGTYFRHYQYINCDLTNTVNESLPNSVTTIGNEFRSHQYDGCNKLKSAPAEVLPDSVTTVGSNFRAYQYYRCATLKSAPTEVFPDSITRISSNFRAYQYRDCANLTSAPNEVFPDSITSVGTNFRAYQYYRCYRILIGDFIHHHNIINILNAHSSHYSNMFYINVETNLDPDTVPRYYTDASHTTTAPITDLTPSVRKYYLQNRTGIDGYEE